jgi:hypothetical protein
MASKWYDGKGRVSAGSVCDRMTRRIEGESTELRFVLANLGSSAAMSVYPHMLPTHVYQ